MSSKAQVLWYLDIAKLVKLAIKASLPSGNERPGPAERDHGPSSSASMASSRSAAASRFGAGNYDSLSKMFFLAPKPVQGLLKVFSFPPIALEPEPWVPATVAGYQSISWDLDNAFDAINEIINKFQPGHPQPPRAAARRPQWRRAPELPEGHLRPARRPDHPGQRLQEADQGGQPAACSWPSPSRTPRRSRTRSTGCSRSPRPRPRSGSSRAPRSTTSDLPNMPNPNAAGNAPGLKGSISFAIAKETLLRHDRDDPARAGAPAGRPDAGRERGVPGGGQGDPRAGSAA